jgi:hypothetical protein
VTGDRRLEILAQLTAEDGPDLCSARLCEVAAEVTSMTGAGITIVAGDIPSGPVCSTDAVSSRIEELQFVLGEGPCLDAFHEDRPVLEPDLAHPDTPRWTAFSTPAIEAGVQGIFAFPLHVGAVRIGALDLYSDRAGPLTTDQYSDALVVADVVARSIISMQIGASPGLLALELSPAGDFRLAVHQAAGMVSVQLGVEIDEALVRLRSHAFAVDRPLSDVADDIVGRRLRLEGGPAPRERR